MGPKSMRSIAVVAYRHFVGGASWTISRLCRAGPGLLGCYRLSIAVPAMTLICIAAALGSLALRRPLFHEDYGSHADFEPLPVWRTIRPLCDRRGTSGFPDFSLNMLVVIVSGDRSARYHGMIYPIRGASPSTAVLMDGSPYSTRVSARRNTLCILKDGRWTYLPLKEGTVTAWYRELHNVDGAEDANLLKEVAARYEGPGRDQLERLVGELEQQQGTRHQAEPIRPSKGAP